MARIPLDTSGGTTTTLKAAMDDINTMTAELYGGEYAPRYVQFGAGNVKDMLSLDITGLLSDTYRMRAIIKGKIVFDNPGTGHPMYQPPAQDTASYDQYIYCLSAGVSIAYPLLKRNAAAASAGQFASRAAGNVKATGSGNIFDPGDEFVVIVSANSGDTVSIADYYKNGHTTPVLSTTITTAGFAIGLSAATALSIGGTPSAVTGNTTNFYRGKLSEIRLWLTDDCHPIKLVTSQAGGAEVTAKTTDTNFTVSPGASLVVGATITNDTTAATATVSTFNHGTGVVTTSAWSAGVLTVGDILSYTTETYDAAQLQAVLADEDPGATGAIGGVLPEVFFGRGQLPSAWNAGANMGTLAALDLDSGNIT